MLQHSSDATKNQRQPGNGGGWYDPDEMAFLATEVESARARFVRWIYWYMAMYPQKVPTKEALAQQLDISRSAVSQLLNPRLKRAPDFKTLVAVKRLTGFSFDALLLTDPPETPRR